MKKTLLLFLSVFTVLSGYSQAYLISTYNGQTVNTCAGRAYDSGGAGGGYGNNQNLTMSICSNNATNTHTKLYFWDFDIDPSDTLFIYDGPNTASPLIGAYNNNHTLFLFPVFATAANPSGCLTLWFKSDGAGNGGGWDAEISCVIACQTVMSDLDSANMHPHPSDSMYVDICFGDTIHFVGNGLFPQNNIIYAQSNATSTFIWNFGDGTIDTGQIINHFYNTIRGYNVELTVYDINGCMSMNSLGVRVRVSDDPIGHIGTLPDICSGTDLNITVGYSSLNNINVTLPTYVQSASLKYDSATFIPDGGALGGMCYNTNVTFNCFNPGQTVTAASDIVSVAANMEHSFVGDLQMLLICPNGQSTIVKEYIQQGGAYLGQPFGGDNHGSFDCTNPPSCLVDPTQNPAGTGWTYTWTMNAPVYNTMQSYATTGNCPPPPPQGNNQIDSSTYMPFQPFSNMIGCPLNGTWNFQICDYWGIDNGWCFWWQLNLDANILPVNWGYQVPIDTVIWGGPYITFNSGKKLTIHPDTGGIYSYNVNIIDKFGCEYDTSVTVNVVATPQVNLGPDTARCEGIPVTLTAPDYPFATYYWLPNGDTTKTITVSQTNNYIAIIQTGNGNISCMGQDTIHVGFFPAPLINFMPDTLEGCEPVTVHFLNGSVPKSATFLWDFGDDSTSTEYSPTHIYNGEGIYSVTLTSTTGTGCSDTYTVNNIIKSHLQPVAQFTVNPPIANIQNANIVFENTSVNPGDLLWKFGDGTTSTDLNPTHPYTTIGVYDVWLVLKTPFGCVDSLLKNVNVIDDSITIPNVITPNGDNINDRFEIKNIESFLTNELIVFDRWGKKVYDKLNYRNDWDGDNLPDGTYYVILRGHGLLRNIEYKGTITIIGKK
ncbi:MAG: PKD domain-containing protein [Bacteroidetes bacterium]|nr:PKD domain-containing protein [Bacteroidota bacterium]